jgi:hypothetical protein
MSASFMKDPCIHCPFRRDVRPFLHPQRARGFAHATCNKYSEFFCHKTLGHDEDEGDTMVVATSLICAGFLSMQINQTGRRVPDGFTPSDLVYDDHHEMIAAYEDEADGVWEDS